ncbi:RNA polymerase sigma factor [Asticcacaulis biprosthecium]|uniref:RNA polymerase sigma factor n=1 Tax=Asticcacaulis biprosthecium TaxID=76891 RepID=UPI0012F4C1DB|nr:sigma-70 family RNA polymerase sigma factor [Asticcacaulis biprosthecium]
MYFRTGNFTGKISFGDQLAFRMLCKRLGPGLFTLLARMTRSQDVAKDLLEDVFVGIWRKACLFDRRAQDARVWLFSIARRRAIEWLRKSTQEGAGPAPNEKVLATECNDESDWVLPGTSSKIRRCLEGMKPDIKNALTLCFSSGLSHGELAVELGVPLEIAQNRIRTGLAELRRVVCVSH